VEIASCWKKAALYGIVWVMLVFRQLLLIEDVPVISNAKIPHFQTNK